MSRRSWSTCITTPGCTDRHRRPTGVSGTRTPAPLSWVRVHHRPFQPRGKPWWLLAGAGRLSSRSAGSELSVALFRSSGPPAALGTACSPGGSRDWQPGRSDLLSGGRSPICRIGDLLSICKRSHYKKLLWFQGWYIQFGVWGRATFEYLRNPAGVPSSPATVAPSHKIGRASPPSLTQPSGEGLPMVWTVF